MTTSTAAHGTHPSCGSPDPRPGDPADRLRWATLLVVLSGTFMATLDVFVINVAIPSIQSDLGAGAGSIQWTIAGFALAVGALVIVAGRLGDLYGRRRVFGLGMAAFTATSAGCGLAPTIEFLVVLRVLQGVSAALLTSQVLAILGATFAGRARVRAFTAYGLTMGIAAVSGQLVGGLLIAADLLGSGWRGCFLLNVPVGLAALALLGRVVPADHGLRAGRPDLLGTALVTSALVALVLPLIQGREQGWPIWTWLLLAGSAVLFVGFGWHQTRLARIGGHPLIDLTVLRERALSTGLVAQLAFAATLPSFFLVFAVYVQEGRGLSALGAGALFVSIGVGYLATSTTVGALARRVGRQTPAVGGAVMVVALLGLLASLDLVGDTRSVWWLAPALALHGAGMGLVIAPLSLAAMSRVAPEHAGLAGGALAMVTQVGGAIGVALIGLVFYGDSSGDPSLRDAFGASLLLLTGLAAVVVLLVQLLPRTGKDAA